MTQPTGTHPLLDRVRVKICGVTTANDALAAAEAGADWIGLNFHPPSPRYLTAEVASSLVESVGRRVVWAGVFVDHPVDEILNIAGRVGFTVAQLHGDERPEDALALQGAGLAVVRAFRLKDEVAVSRMLGWLERARVIGLGLEAVLVDAYVPGQAGGTGTAIDSRLLDELKVKSRPLSLPPLVLSGGLTAKNVADRVRQVRPWMVDTASGVEVSPGRKDVEKMQAFCEAAKSVVLSQEATDPVS
jgi:phosphoribosylanthranilate isomerase